MATNNPYSDLPEEAFWKTAVGESSPTSPYKIYKKKWEITTDNKVATAGSCFAQHISRYLRANDFCVLDQEPAPYGLPESEHSKYGYSMYSARYGNIYTVQQLLQLVREVIGDFTPENYVWRKQNGQFVDALRPNVEPFGLESVNEVQIHRLAHLANVRKMIQNLDVFVFTFGLTEAWVHKTSGTVYPIAPGVIAGDFNSSEFEFRNFQFCDVLNDFKEFLKVASYIRQHNPIKKILVTVSPVPLTATASGEHVLRATTYSKSILRAVAGQLANENESIAYFPSYEIITNQSARANFFEANLRTVKREGVETVMSVFMEEHGIQGGSITSEKITKTPKTEIESFLQQEQDVICEDELLERFIR